MGKTRISVIKIFYRPANLPMQQEEAFKGIKTKSTSNGVKVVNNSPYYINLAGLSVNNKAIKLNQQIMLLPHLLK
ncbi:hypothetical protein [Providencia huaxiensis]|uniref:fimbrial biogenesis chaperone n=1 Tax=Providencia huaxiensis TaxID=2027290 RepID=UPI0034DD3346